MPYRLDPLNPKCVQVQQGELWQNVTCHDSENDAQSHLTALQINVSDKFYYHGGAIKSYNDDIVSGYLVRFTNANQRDLRGEFFDPTTEFYFDRGYEPINARVLYHHGLDKTMSVNVIGTPVKAQVDDAGIWFEAQLKIADEYKKYIQQLIERGELGWSSGALPQSVHVDDTGHIKSWAIIEASLTPKPAMPFTNRIATVKTLRPESKEPSEAREIKSNRVFDGTNSTKQQDEKIMEDKEKNDKMSGDTTKMDDVLAMLRQVLDMMDMDVEDEEVYEEKMRDMMDVEDDIKSITPQRIAELVINEQRKREADMSAAKKMIDDYRKSVPADDDQRIVGGKASEKYAGVAIHTGSKNPHESDYIKSVRETYGITTREAPELNLGHVVKAMYQGTMKAQNPYIGTQGGYLVGEELAPEILSPLRAQAVAFDAGVQRRSVTGAGYYTLPRMTTAPAAFRPGITQDITDDEAEFDIVTGSLRPIAFKVFLPRQMLMTSAYDVQAMITREGRRSIDLQIDKEIFIGEGAVTGSNTGAEIKGILRTLQTDSVLSSTNVVSLGTNGGDITFEDIIDGETQLADNNIPDSDEKAFVTNPKIRATLRKLTDADGNPLFRNGFNSEAFRDVIGYPMFTSTQIPKDITTGSNSNTGYAFFGAFRYAEYLMGDQMEIIVDEVTLANKLMVRIIGYTFSDLIIHYPEAFYVMTGVNAS